MPKLDECLTGKAEAGDIPAKAKEVAKRFRKEAAELVKEGRISESEEHAFAVQFAEDYAAEVAFKRRQTLAQASIQNEVMLLDRQAREAGIGIDKAMRNRVSQDPTQQAIGSSLSSRIDNIKNDAHGLMVDVLDQFRTRFAGFTQKLDGIDDVMREMHGEKTGNVVAAELAEAIQAASEMLRKRFNAAGGHIAKREDWGFFQKHDSSRVAAAKAEDWTKFVRDRLDRDKTLNELGKKMTDAEFDEYLLETYKTIAQRGLNKVEPGKTGPRTGSSINRRANQRHLVFRNADAWIEYQNQYGAGNLYDHIIGSIDAFARDVAILEVMGPQPEATLQLMRDLINKGIADDVVSKEGRAAAKLSNKIGHPSFQLDADYHAVTGRGAITADGVFAETSQANRNVVTSAVLGGAFWSAIGDIPLQALTAKINGIPIHKTLGRIFKTFATNSHADRRLAIQLGFGAQGWASRALAAQRVLGEVTGPAWSERLADRVLRLSLLSPWTEAGRYGFQTEFLSHLTMQSAKKFANLTEPMRHSLARHGISPEDWEVIRHTPKFVDDATGAEFIRARDIIGDDFFGKNFDIGNKLQEMILKETEFAVPIANARVRGMLQQQTYAGTFIGEVTRNIAMFKSFPLSLMYMHYQRAMAQAGVMKKAEYAMWLFAGMTTMGAIGQTMTDISTGKEPRPFDEPSLWMDALVRGGALGLAGDVVFADHGYGRDIWDSLLGPVAGQVTDISKLTIGNIQEFANDERTNAGRELSRFIEQNMPGRSIWYSRLAMERLLFDQLDKAFDPRAAQSFRAIENRVRDDKNQEFFSRPGSFDF